MELFKTTRSTHTHTLVFLCSVVVVDGLAVPLAFTQFARQVLLLLLVVMPQQFLPIIRIHVLLLFDDLPLDLLDLKQQKSTWRVSQIDVHKHTHTHARRFLRGQIARTATVQCPCFFKGTSTDAATVQAAGRSSAVDAGKLDNFSELDKCG